MRKQIAKTKPREYNKVYADGATLDLTLDTLRYCRSGAENGEVFIANSSYNDKGEPYSDVMLGSCESLSGHRSLVDIMNNLHWGSSVFQDFHKKILNIDDYVKTTQLNPIYDLWCNRLAGNGGSAAYRSDALKRLREEEKEFKTEKTKC